MKRIIALLLALCALISLTACGMEASAAMVVPQMAYASRSAKSLMATKSQEEIFYDLSDGDFTQDDLEAMAAEAEKNSRDYTTVSTTGVELEYPYESEYLEEPLKLRVKSEVNGGILFMPKPKTGNGNLGTVLDWTNVLVIAKYRSYYFFVTEDGRMGWNWKNYFVEGWGSKARSNKEPKRDPYDDENNPYSIDNLWAMANRASATTRDYSTTSTTGVSLTLPEAEDYLDKPIKKQVKSEVNGGILFMPLPKTGNGNLGTVLDWTDVTIIAKHKSYYFFVTDDGRMGWNGKQYFVD